jgi:predicted RNA-binding protein (TIGR00451 family)
LIRLKSPTRPQLRKLQGIANYQFGKDAGVALFARGIRIACSKRTGRIRHIFRHGKLIATLRPKDGYLALTTEGALLLLSRMKHPSNLVVVQDDVADFVKAGGDVFAKHVAHADESLRPAEEVVVTNQEGVLLGVGKAVLSGNDMRFFKRGVAVRIRKGAKESDGPVQGEV